MLLLYYFFISVAATYCKAELRGIEMLDQESDEELEPEGDVDYAQYPYVVAVFNAFKKAQSCVGIIVSDKAVLTIEFCVTDRNSKLPDPFYISVLAGVVDMRDRIQDQWRHAVRLIPKKTKTPQESRNFLLLVLNRPFYVDSSTQPTKLVMNHYSIVMVNTTDCQSEEYHAKGGEYLCGIISNSKGPSLDCPNADGGLVLCKYRRRLYPAGLATEFHQASCSRSASPFAFRNIAEDFDWISTEMDKIKH